MSEFSFASLFKYLKKKKENLFILRSFFSYL